MNPIPHRLESIDMMRGFVRVLMAPGLMFIGPPYPFCHIFVRIKQRYPHIAMLSHL